jgi:hypothetical protein
MRHVMTEAQLFLDPGSAPDPDPAWLAGCSAEAMIKTDRAVSRDSRTRWSVCRATRAGAGPLRRLRHLRRRCDRDRPTAVPASCPDETRGLRPPALAAESFRLCERTPAVLPPHTALPPVATGPGGFPDGLPESERRRLDAPKRWPRAYRRPQHACQLLAAHPYRRAGQLRPADAYDIFGFEAGEKLKVLASSDHPDRHGTYPSQTT